MNENDDRAHAAPTLSTSTQSREGVSVVTAVGQVDLTNTHRLHYDLSSALHPDRPLIADLSAVTFLDSRGLRTLLIMQRNADLQGARLIIVPSAEIAALLTLAAADTLTVRPSLATAMHTARENPSAAPAPQDTTTAAAN